MASWGLTNWFGGQQGVGATQNATPPARSWVEWLRSTLGGYAGPRQLSRDPRSEDVRKEKVHSGPPGIILPWFLPYFDDVTGETAQIRHAYRRMLANSHVKAALLGKLLNVAALNLEVHPVNRGLAKHDREAADFVKFCLTENVEGGWPGAVWSILSGGLVDGYSLNEKVYGPERSGRWAGKWSLQQLKPKDVGNDVILRTDEFRNIIDIQGLRYNAGQTYAPGLFLIWRNLPLYGSPTGMSDFRAPYKDYWMMDTVQKLRIICAEKYSTPFLVGTYDNVAVKPSLDEMLSLVKSRNWASVPAGTKVDLMNLATGADAIYANFITMCEHNIFVGITGAILQSLEGSVEDGRGSSAVHKGVADRWVRFLAASLEATLNDRRSGLVRELVDLNFVVSEYPRVSLAGVDAGEMLRELDIDRGLLDMGLELSKQSLYEQYGRQAPAPGEAWDVLGGPEPIPADPEGMIDTPPIAGREGGAPGGPAVGVFSEQRKRGVKRRTIRPRRVA